MTTSTPLPGRYAEVHAASLADPEGFWMRGGAAIDWDDPGRALRRRGRGVYGRWFPDGAAATPATTPSTATSRRAAASRRRSSTTARHRHEARRSPTRELQDEVATPRRGARRISASARATASSSTCRWCPRRVDRDARLRPHRRGPFGRVRRLRGAPSSRPASTMRARRSSSRPPAASSRAASSPTSRCSTRRSSCRAHKPERCLILQRPQAAADADRRARPRLGRGGRAARRRRAPPACRSRPPTRSTSSTPPARPGSPKGVVRDNGGHLVALDWSMQNLYGVEPGRGLSGPPPMSAGSSAIPTSSTRRCCTAAPPSCTRASRSARPMPAPSGGSSPSTASRRCSPRRPRFRAIKQRGPRRRAASRAYDLSRLPHPVPRRRARRPATRSPGPSSMLARAGHRPLVADRDRLADRRQPGRPRPAAGQARLADACRCRATTCSVLDEGGRPVPPDTIGTLAIKPAAAARAACRRCGAPTSASARAYLNDFPGYYKTADAGMIDEDGYVYVMGRTDDIINVAGHRLSTGGMEEVLAAHPDVAECAVIGIARRLKGEVPLRLRGAESRRRARPGRDRARARRRWCASGSARSPPSSWRSRSSACRRPAPARSCAAPCRRSPTGGLDDAGDHRRPGDPRRDRREPEGAGDRRTGLRRRQTPPRRNRGGVWPSPPRATWRAGQTRSSP